ncbi:MAG TPA: aminodeoxychorismate lyase [Yinghuangia sp.]|nr:aminodeoxychorismate lyase [Yinghuangia sp.]
MKIWLGDSAGGGLVHEEDATVSVLDHGFTVGDGVFETMKAVDGQAFALTRHLARLTRSARGLGLPDPDEDMVRVACAEVLGANPIDGIGRLRVTYTGGVAPLGSDRGAAPATLTVALGPAKPRPQTTAVVTVPWTRNENSPTAGLKTTSYADNVVMVARAARQNASEALFANTAGLLCEGTGSNVFLAIGGRLLTPRLESGCLAGITRALVLEWTDAEEADLPFSALAEADEVFLTSSLRDVQAVHRVDERELPAPGPLTRAAAESFATRSAADMDP